MNVPEILPYLASKIIIQKLQIEGDLSVYPVKRIIGYKFILGKKHFVSIVRTKRGEKVERYLPGLKPSVDYIRMIEVEKDRNSTLEEITVEFVSDELLWINLTDDNLMTGENEIYLVRKVQPIYEYVDTYGISIQMDSQWEQLMTYINTETVDVPVKKEDDDGYYHYMKIELEDDTLYENQFIEFWRAKDGKVKCLSLSEEFIDSYWDGVRIDKFKSEHVFPKHQKHNGEIRDEIVLVGNKREYVKDLSKNFVYYITRYKSGPREGTMRLGMGWLVSLEEKTFTRQVSLNVRKIILK